MGTPNVNPPPAGAMLAPDHSADRGSAWPCAIGAVSILHGIRMIVEFHPRVELAYMAYAEKMFTAWGGAPDRLDTLAVLLQGMLLASGVGLIVAGALLASRRRTGVILHYLWAPLGILATAAYSSMTWAGYYDEAAGAMVEAQSAVSQVGMIYPVFLLIWLGQDRVRRQIGLWRTPEGRSQDAPATRVWPVVVGAVSVYWAARGLLASTMQFAAGAIYDFAEVRGELEGLWWQWAAIQACLYALLLTAGWLLMRRRPLAVALHLIYGATAPLAAAGHAFFHGIALEEEGIDLYGLLGAPDFGFIALISRPLPEALFGLFMLVWFCRPGIRAQAKLWPQASRASG